MKETIQCNKYRPLPDELYIGMSSIEGNGLFTTEFIEKGRKFGISHIIVEIFILITLEHH